MEQGDKLAAFSRDRSLGWLLAVVHSRAADQLDERLQKVGLNLGMWPTLMMLWEEEGLTQVELASRCMTAHYTTTRVLDSLEKKQLVERRKHPTSRRSHLIYLTDEGRALKSALIAEAMDVNDSLLSVLQPQEQQQFLSLLAKMVAAGSAD